MRHSVGALLVLWMSNLNIVQAQTSDLSNIVLTYPETQALLFHVYDPPLRIAATYTTVSQAVNQYPEQLMQSIFSARDQAWVDYNTLGGAAVSSKLSESHFQRIASMNKETNYFELIHKLTFTMGGTPTALVKFFIYEEGQKPVSGCAIMQQVNGRWQKTSNPSVSILSIALMRIKSDVMQGILFDNVGDAEVSALRRRVTAGGTFDLALFEREFTSWYSPSRDTRKLSLFTDPKAW